MRAAIYARFSTDKQREVSIQDQQRVCQARADAEGWVTVSLHADQGVSGSTPVASREGGRALLADAIAERFDALLMEGLDRLSRDLVEQERIVRRLEHQGIRIVGVSDGYDSTSQARKLHRGMRGLINEVYLDDLRAKTHRGLSGQVERGLFAGGMSYGYRSVDVPNGHRLEIVPGSAERVRWVFEQYASGTSIPAIVQELNSQRIPSPRGSTWVVSGLYGSPAKGTGVLNNELYVGRYIWNRSRWVKDPDTGVRKRVERPRSEWRVTDRPDLRIVPDELWRAVRRRMDTPTRLGGNKGKSGRPLTLLGGLMTCGLCGGPVVAVTRDSYGCSNSKNRGQSVCTGVTVKRAVAEIRLLAEIRDTLLLPVNVAKLQARVQQILRERARARDTGKDAIARRRQELSGEIDNLTAAVASMGLSAALASRLRRAEVELASLAEAAPERINVNAIPDLMAKYRRMLADLPGTTARSNDKARKAIVDMLGNIRLMPDGNALWAEMDAVPNGLLLAAGLDIHGIGSGGAMRVPGSTRRLRLL